MTSLAIILMLVHLSSSQQVLFQPATIPLIIWSPNQTFFNIKSDTKCAALATSNGQCQFLFDEDEMSCKVGTSPIYQNTSYPFPTLDIYYAEEWSTWSAWSSCSATCIGYKSGGNMTRTRICLSHGCPSLLSPSGCFGNETDVQHCPLGVLCKSGSMMMVVGGLDANNVATSSVEIINAFGRRVQNCRSVADYPFPVVGAVGIFINNQSMVCGGLGNNIYQKACYAYDYENNVWNPSYSMNKARYFPAAYPWLSGGWWISGGFDGNSMLSSSETFNVSSSTGFTAGINLPVATFKHSTVRFWDSVTTKYQYLLMGGNATAFQNQPWIIDPNSGAATQTTPPLFPTSFTGEGVFDPTYPGMNIITSSAFGSQVFLIANRTWVPGPPANLPVVDASNNAYMNNLFVFGGRSLLDGTVQNSTFVYGFVSGNWSLLSAQMIKPREGHAVFIVPDVYCE